MEGDADADTGTDAVDRVSVTIAAPPDAVWALVTDLGRMGEWSPETTSCRWFGRRTGPEVGATFVGWNRRGWARWCTTNAVERAEPGQLFGWRVRETGVRWSYELEQEGDGTRLTEIRDLSRARTWLLRATGVFVGGVDDHADELRAGMRTTLDRIKAAAEG
jgi:uncharacterized protein YndB with AHSA1/START domain